MMSKLFEILFVVDKPDKISKEVKAFLRGNLVSHILEMEGRRKHKFDKG